ncbi:hypothetical protein Aduo_019703 [Ancylostoma duodenale]
MPRAKRGQKAPTPASDFITIQVETTVRDAPAPPASPDPPAPPVIVEDDRPRPTRLVDAIGVYMEANALLALGHPEMNELRACVNYVMAGMYLQFAERNHDENVCPDLMRKLVDLFGEEALVAPDYLFLGVLACSTPEEETRRVRARIWPSHISTITNAADEVLRCCAEAFACLRGKTNNPAAPCPFFAHGTDDIVAKNGVRDDDRAAMRKLLRDSITIRMGHAYNIHIQQCLRRADYEKGYKYLVLGIQAIAKVFPGNPRPRHRTVAGMLLKRWIGTLSIFIGGITDKVGWSMTPDDMDRMSELCKFVNSFTGVVVYIDNDADISNPATPLPERMTIPPIDVCLTAAAAEKVADAYSLRAKDTIERAAEAPEGPGFDAAVEDMEIARVMYAQALALLDTVRDKFALKCNVRILTNFVSVCLMQFHAFLNLERDPQMIVDEVTIEYEKVIDRLEIERSVTPFDESAYSNCLLSLGSAFMLFAERHLDHPQRTDKDKATTYLENALRVNKALLRRNIEPDQRCQASLDILSIFDNLIPLKKSAFEDLERGGAGREEMRRVANEDVQLILSFYDHMLNMVSDPELPLKQRNFTFEICVQHQQLMNLPYVKDKVKIYGCRQVLTWLKQMVPIILTIDGVRAMARLREVWDLVVELLSNMLEKLPQNPFVKKSVECMKKKRPTDDVTAFSKLILDSVDEALTLFPSVNIADELEGISW